MSTATKKSALHAALVFVVAFGGALVTAKLHDASLSDLVALIQSAAVAGVVAVLHYLAGLIPTSADLAERKAAKAAKTAEKGA